MFQLQDPYIASIEGALRADNLIDSEKVKLTDLSKPLIGFWTFDTKADRFDTEGNEKTPYEP